MHRGIRSPDRTARSIVAGLQGWVIGMKAPERLRGEVEATERKAAAIARDMAALLGRPVAERAGLPALLADFGALHETAGHAIAQLRRMVGRVVQAEADAGETVAGFTRAARTRHLTWGRIAQAVGDCLAGHEWPLLPAARPKFDLGAVQESVVNKVFTDAHAAVNPASQDSAAGELGCFPDIALDADHFVWNAHLACRMLLAQKRSRPWSFLDVGCGGGMKVALAAEMFDRADGLDYDPGYVDAALRNFAAMKAGRCHAFQADGLTFDGYGDYDAVYFFQPMRDEDGLHALERRIVEQTRPGGLLLATYPGFLWRAAGLGCRQVMGNVYVKDMDEDAMEAWKAETRRMGPHLHLHGKGVPRGSGWLRPLWLACLANGIRPEV